MIQKSSLFELGAEVADLEQVLDRLTDPNTHEVDSATDGELLLNWLNNAEGRFADKAEAYCGLIGELEAVAKAQDEESNRIKALSAVNANKAKRLRDNLFKVMKMGGLSKVKTTRYQIAIKGNGGKQAVQVTEFDDARIPDEFKKIQTVLDNDKIRQALESGEVLDFAQLLPRGERLEIK